MVQAPDNGGAKVPLGVDSSEAEVHRAAALHAVLGGLPMSELRKRAVAAGVGGDAIDEAGDSERPKVALIDLLVGVAPDGPNPAP